MSRGQRFRDVIYRWNHPGTCQSPTCGKVLADDNDDWYCSEQCYSDHGI